MHRKKQDDLLSMVGAILTGTTFWFIVGVLILLLLAVFTSGCRSAATPPAVVINDTPDSQEYQISADPTPTADIPSTAGKDDDSLLAVITVYPSANPKPTKVKVFKKHKSAWKKFLPVKREDTAPPIEATSSDPHTEIDIPTIRPWTWTASWIIILLAALWYTIRRWGSTIIKPISVIADMIARVFKK